MSNWIEFAYKKTKESTHPAHKMCSVILRGGKLISYNVNLGDRGKHAEKRSLRKHRNYEDCTLIVVRSNGRCSKPCDKCMKAIISAGIKKIIFTNNNNNIEEMRI